MKNNRSLILLNLSGIALSLCLCMACGDKKTQEERAKKEREANMPEPVTSVETIVLQAGDFHHELISNGKLLTRRKVELRFQTTDPIAGIYVKNGDRVKKGTKLAELNTTRLKSQLRQAEINLEKSELVLQDAIFSQGYKRDERENIPVKTLQTLKTKHGYDAAELQLEQAQYDYEQAVLRAPFDGVVANLFSKELNQAESSTFCVLLDNSEMEVNFSILENELGLVKTGDPVTVKPLVVEHEEITGKISEINPLVEANGLVRLRAVIPNPSGKLYEGMNVRISIQRAVPSQWVVPKEAVLLRTGKQVMFTKREGRAVWNYVETGLENSESFTVTGKDLQEGDTVIISNNMNLAHDAPVRERRRR